MAKASFGSSFIRVMSCWRQLEDASGKEGSAAKEEDDDDDRSSLGDDEETETGSLQPYRKNKWVLIASWSNIDKEEAYRQAAVIMTEDFDIAGGLAPNMWGEPSEKKIGPFGHRSVSFFVLFPSVSN